MSVKIKCMYCLESESGLPITKFQELLRQSFEKHVDSEKYKTDVSYVEQSMEAISVHITNLLKALQENEEKYLAQQKEKVCILID